MIFDKASEVPKYVHSQYYSHYSNNRPRAAWVDDKDITKCFRCKGGFSLFVRKHHCRHCGRIFCYDCCNVWMKIDSNVRSSLTTTIPSFFQTGMKERVCRDCAISLKQYFSIQKMISIFNLIGLTIRDMKTIAVVNREWNSVASYYESIFRNIQYRIPQTLNAIESVMIKNNMDLLKGHSAWIVQISKLANNSNMSEYDITKIAHAMKGTIRQTNREREKEQQIVHRVQDNAELKSKKESKTKTKTKENSKNTFVCWCLRCTRDCRPCMTPENGMLCLPQCILHKLLLTQVIRSLEDCPVFEFECYLPIIVTQMGRKDVDAERSKQLQLFLEMKCSKSLVLSHSLFWLYSRLMDSNRSIYYPARTHFLKILDRDVKNQIHSSYKYVCMLKRCALSNSIETTIHILNDFSSDCMKHMITYPLKTDRVIVRNVTENIVQMQSKSKPVVFSLDCMHKISYDTKQEKVMLKKDDVRKDVIIMNCIILMDNILRNAGINLHIVDYRIIALSHTIGLIEMVPNSKTVLDIQNSKFSIQNFIFEHNSTVSIEDVRAQYMKSCAAYCLIGYLLGIGDRHLENIMITKSGFIFHIDFEFILGHDPKLIRPEIRITPEMIDAMGGYESKYYIEFQTICKQAFQCLRRHAGIFHLQLLQLATEYPPLPDNFTPEFIKMQVMKRFMVGENHDEAELLFITKMANSSSSSYKHKFVDYIHEKGNSLQLMTDTLRTFTGLF